MHPEIVSDTPGRCPKCGMALVSKPEKAASKVVPLADDKGLGPLTWRNYLPLIAIFGVLTLTTMAFTLRDVRFNSFSPENTITYFMIGFFLTFATFKLLDLQGFAHGYATYDLLATRVPQYGYVYPFIELLFGLAMIFIPFSFTLLIAELVVMTFSGIGVAIKLAKREEFMCACLGTLLKVPLTKVTLIEDFGMALLAGVMLFLAL